MTVMAHPSQTHAADHTSRNASSERIKETAEHYGAKAQDAVNDAVDHGREAVEHATDYASDALVDLERRIRREPLKSAAIAAGAGFVLALLARR